MKNRSFRLLGTFNLSKWIEFSSLASIPRPDCDVAVTASLSLRKSAQPHLWADSAWGLVTTSSFCKSHGQRTSYLALKNSWIRTKRLREKGAAQVFEPRQIRPLIGDTPPLATTLLFPLVPPRVIHENGLRCQWTFRSR